MMFDFAITLKSKSKQAEFSFLKLMVDNNHSYVNVLMNQTYDLKKSHFKLINKIGKKVPYNQAKNFERACEEQSYKVAQFSILLSHVHLFFTVALNFRIFQFYNSSSLSFGKLLLHDDFNKFFDSHERLILGRFNIIRNLIAHSAISDLFYLFNHDDFDDLVLLIKSLSFLESELCDYLRKNSFFANTSNYWDNVNGILPPEHFPFIKALLHEK